jgi:putative transposase
VQHAANLGRIAPQERHQLVVPLAVEDCTERVLSSKTLGQPSSRSGRTIRVLTVVDTFTRECLALEVDSCLPSRRVTRALDSVNFQRGRPESTLMDNGSELTSRHFLAWGIDRRISLTHIQPGNPVQDAFIESFNGRLRDECLNTNWFRILWEARQKITAWRDE